MAHFGVEPMNETRTDGRGPRLLIVGGRGGTNVGDSLQRAAAAQGLESTLLDSAQAFRAPRLVARVNWWLRGHRPSRLSRFAADVVDECRRFRPRWLVATGAAPLDREALEAIGELGVRRVSFLTDDPWNPSSRSRWFLRALPAYDRVFSPRRANLEDLGQLGCRNVAYLPFGVDPHLFFPEALGPDDRARYASDVFFAGGADRARLPYITALLRAGLRVGLYGDYWHRYAETRAVARGQAPPEVVRRSIVSATLCLCLVRRANRDGHSMRSFEVPAAGGCVLAEDTDEHRALFGADDEAVAYFRTPRELVAVARQLMHDEGRRRRLARHAHRLVADGSSSYQHRLCAMLDLTFRTVSSPDLAAHAR
jgi:hypothetical protein